MNKVLGVDPGSRTTGYAVIEKNGRAWRHVDNGIVHPKSSLPMCERLLAIYSALVAIVKRYEPGAMALEQVFLDDNPQTAIKLGQARGVAMLVAAQHRLVLAEYTPLAVKQAIVGYGRATKFQVQEMVKRHFSLPEIACEDASDALAIAYTHALTATSKLVATSKLALIKGEARRKPSSWRAWSPAA